MQIIINMFVSPYEKNSNFIKSYNLKIQYGNSTILKVGSVKEIFVTHVGKEIV